MGFLVLDSYVAGVVTQDPPGCIDVTIVELLRDWPISYPYRIFIFLSRQAYIGLRAVGHPHLIEIRVRQ